MAGLVFQHFCVCACVRVGVCVALRVVGLVSITTASTTTRRKQKERPPPPHQSVSRAPAEGRGGAGGVVPFHF